MHYFPFLLSTRQQVVRRGNGSDDISGNFHLKQAVGRRARLYVFAAGICYKPVELLFLTSCYWGTPNFNANSAAVTAHKWQVEAPRLNPSVQFGCHVTMVTECRGSRTSAFNNNLYKIKTPERVSWRTSLSVKGNERMWRFFTLPPLLHWRELDAILNNPCVRSVERWLWTVALSLHAPERLLVWFSAQGQSGTHQMPYLSPTGRFSSGCTGVALACP